MIWKDISLLILRYLHPNLMSKRQALVKGYGRYYVSHLVEIYECEWKVLKVPAKPYFLTQKPPRLFTPNESSSSGRPLKYSCVGMNVGFGEREKNYWEPCSLRLIRANAVKLFLNRASRNKVRRLSSPAALVKYERICSCSLTDVCNCILWFFLKPSFPELDSLAFIF